MLMKKIKELAGLMMGDRRRTEEHTMCSCFSLLLQSRACFVREQRYPWARARARARTSNCSASGVHFECGHCYICWFTSAHVLKNVSLNTAVYMWSWNVNTEYLLVKWQIAKTLVLTSEGPTGRWADQETPYSWEFQGWSPFRNRHFCHLIWAMFCHLFWKELGCHSMKCFAIIMKFHTNSVLVTKYL